MPWQNQPDIFGLLAMLIISIVSGFISISRRILNGHPPSVLWIISEFSTAILCGYLMFQVYPTIESVVPNWFTMPVAIAVAAHVGGRIFQEVENVFIEKYKHFLRQTN